MSFLALCWSDYLARCARARDEPAARRLLLALPRLLADPSLQAVLLVRVANASPRPLWWFWRTLMIHFHAMDWSGPLRIGPGFQLPRPHGVCLLHGSTLGAGVRFEQNATLGGDAVGGRPVIGDGVTLCAGAVLTGAVTIGENSVIGPNCVVTRNVAPNRRVTLDGVVPLHA